MFNTSNPNMLYKIIPYTEETNLEIDDIKELQEFDELSLDDEDKEHDQYVTMVNTTRNPHTMTIKCIPSMKIIDTRYFMSQNKVCID